MNRARASATRDVDARWQQDGDGEHYATGRWRTRRARERDPRLVERLLASLGPRAPHETVLDVPCGTGRLRAGLEARGLRWIGADISPSMLDETGGILSDVTVARVGPERVVVGVNGPLDVARLTTAARRARATGAHVDVREITDDTCCVAVWGPRALDILAPLTDLDVSPSGLRYYRCAETTVADVPALLTRVSYVGEFGWEITTSAADGRRLAAALGENAEAVGAVWGGRAAMDCLRIEKGYRSWGADMTRTDSPHEAGVAFAVAKDHEFVGRAAVAERPVLRRLHTLVADDPDTVLLGSEPLRHNGSDTGYITSAAWSPTVGATVAYAWGPADLRPGDAVTAEWFGRQRSLRVVPPVVVDPENLRLKGDYR